MKRDFGPGVMLAATAHEALIHLLRKHGNQVSPQHSLALEHLLDGLTKQGLGTSPGRRAYALPCGSGKTLSVVAWVATQYRLGLGLSIAISAQQIEALCSIKTGLVDAGVPEGLIGIRHSAGTEVRWPDTGDDDRLIMLGTHARIRGKLEMPAFCRFQGSPRDLLIWDESLISSDSTTVSVQDAITALRHFSDEERRPMLYSVLQRLQRKVEEEQLIQRAGGAASVFTLLSEDESNSALVELGHPHCTAFGYVALREARDVLKELTYPMSVLDVGGGGTGLVLMRCSIAIDPELVNIAVLDASYVVSELCKADPTIRDASTSAMRTYKDYSNVLVKQTTAASGRWQFSRRSESALALNAAVQSIKDLPRDESILVVTYMAKGSVDITHNLKVELRRSGIDLDAVLPCGKPRIRFTTWGKHTTDNAFSDSRHVVALGVLRQSSAAVAAAMAGQRDDASFRMTQMRLLEVELSLLACNIMQAMNRGRCRRVDEHGKALAMTLHLITKEKGLEALLTQAMPGLGWQVIEAGKPTKASEAAHQIKAFMMAVPSTQQKISKRSIFDALGLKLAPATKAEAMTLAVTLLAVEGTRVPLHRWRVDAQSLVRVTVA
jgi:hypothetical protein